MAGRRGYHASFGIFGTSSRVRPALPWQRRTLTPPKGRLALFSPRSSGPPISFVPALEPIDGVILLVPAILAKAWQEAGGAAQAAFDSGSARAPRGARQRHAYQRRAPSAGVERPGPAAR